MYNLWALQLDVYISRNHMGRAKANSTLSWLWRFYCEQSELSGEFNGTDFLYIYINKYMFQAVRRAVNVLNVSTCI